MNGDDRGAEDVFLVFVQGKPGREGAYAAWFEGGHMADMRALPGVNSAHAFRLAQTSGPPPAELCAIYEFADGPAVLDLIGRSKGTDALPHSEDQGRMVWRLFETRQAWPDVAMPTGRDMVIALIGSPRGETDQALLLEAGAALAAAGARYVRALSLSPVQPTRGSEFGLALIVSADLGTAATIDAVADQLAGCFAGMPTEILVAAPMRSP